MAPQNCVPNPVAHTPSLQSLEVGFESFIESIMGPESDKAGLARISLPHKYWSKAGISHDESARGPSWQKGEHLGDMEIASPIKQAAAGKGGVYEFEMITHRKLTVAEFRDIADKYKAEQLGKMQPQRGVLSPSPPSPLALEVSSTTSSSSSGVESESPPSSPSSGSSSLSPHNPSDDELDEMGRHYWRSLGPMMNEPIYGADFEGSLYNGEAASGWNVDKLDTCLQLLMSDRNDNVALPGVTSAYLYFGMWGATFAAHTEDMNLLSINILHAGEPKYWYSISAKDSSRYEALAASYFPEEANECPDFLRHKKYLLSPSILKNAGISVTRTIQRAGDAIITMPNAYHWGFNTGFNVAESTNFAVPEWIPSGRSASVCMCVPFSVRIGMDRFEALLEEFDDDPENGGSYVSWARMKATNKRVKEEKRAKKAKKPLNGDEQDPPSLEKWKSKKSNIVLVAKLDRLTERRKAASSKKKSPNQKQTQKKKPQYSSYVWKVADHPRGEIKPGTSVLCMLPAMDLDGDSKSVVEAQNTDSVETTVMKSIISEGLGSMWFEGKIDEVLDEHVRIHFQSLKKDEDVWMEANNEGLMLDGGAVDTKELKAAFENRECQKNPQGERPKAVKTAKKRAVKNEKMSRPKKKIVKVTTTTTTSKNSGGRKDERIQILGEETKGWLTIRYNYPSNNIAGSYNLKEVVYSIFYYHQQSGIRVKSKDELKHIVGELAKDRSGDLTVEEVVRAKEAEGHITNSRGRVIKPKSQYDDVEQDISKYIKLSVRNALEEEVRKLEEEVRNATIMCVIQLRW
ncbi:hypothetical protein TrLO_g8491 [Triparma laevis f. longispina]|uniref:JmjC domain-containing protein n=1 Tax=Triparma laevis f. longispina TaxID=1714387 RepID=A0A9W7C2B3_9STRA|nr:hypothetical protein TrLO_g8491 [Triparma laevis f. longispina]